MSEPRDPEDRNSAKEGVKEGETPSTSGPKGGKRPAHEEDTYGGAERTQNEDVKSDQAKP